MQSIQDIINGIIQVEGGYTNNPNDAGGPTNFGITLKTLQAYQPGATIDDVKNMQKSKAYSIYEDVYYTKSGISKITPLSFNIAAKILDISVNMGTGVGIKFLQQVLNAFNNNEQYYKDLVVDGGLGPVTLGALSTYLKVRGTLGEAVLLKAVNCLQGARYIELSQQYKNNETFVYGWIANRITL
jgi:lysozyme family protein